MDINIIRLLKYVLVMFCLTCLQPVQAIEDNFLGLHIVTRYVKLEHVKSIVDLAKENGYSHIVVQIDDGVDLDSFPGSSRADALTKSEFVEFVDYVKDSGMEFIPEIKLLTHQQKFFQDNHPHLMYNKSTYDPSLDAVYEKVFRYLEEVIEITDPQMVHIGHDELAGLSKHFVRDKLNRGEKVLPSDLFYSDVVRVYNFLREKNIEVGMWGDMLLSPREKGLKKLQAVHGIPDGYGPELRKKLPTDIVIFDWHYHNMKKPPIASVDLFVEDGFDVVASVWDDPESTNVFIDYINERHKPRVLVTLWFYVQHQKWDIVESIVRDSGETYRESVAD